MSPLSAPVPHLSRGPRPRLFRYSARSLFAVAAASSCVALSGAAVAAASTVHANKAVSAAAGCGNISASSVSGIVGYTVPAATADTDSYPVDQALNISATATDCSYETLPSAADPYGSKVVSLSYE